MKSTSRVLRAGLVALPVAVVGLLWNAPPVGAQSLGAAATSAIQASAGVTAAGGAGTVVNGNVGSSPSASITGFPPALIVAPFLAHPNDAFAVAAQAAVDSLFVSLTSGACSTAPLTQMNGVTFTPGTHCFGAATPADLSAGGSFTLNGAGTYIFRVGSALTANVGSTIILTGGADACDVFWQVGSSATLNGVSFAGNVVSQASVTLGTSAALTGRALARTGSVSLAGNNTVGGCSAPPACPAITLSPATLPNGTIAIPYTQALTASGGLAPYTFTLTAGSLPNGLSLAPGGAISGTPTTAGTFTFTVQAADSNGCLGTRTYTIVIPAPVCPAITLAPATLPNGTIAIPYSQAITASGGLAPYTFTLIAGSLPNGLSLAPGGAISGTPTTAGTFTFTVQAADSNGCLGNRIYAIVIPPPGCPVIVLSPATLPNGTIAIPYSQALSASGGLAPYTFTVIAGSLPSGLSLAPGGAISGTPTTAGTFTFTVRATDSNGCPGAQIYTIVIPAPVCPAITLAPATLPNGGIAIPYSQTITASGGLAPYTFTLIAGSLPNGLSLAPGGAISGTPTTAGTFTFTVQAADSNGCLGNRIYTIVIPPPGCPVIVLAPTSVPGGTIAIPYSQTITASGGLAPYIFTVTAGSLPPGLTLSTGGVLSGTPTTVGSSSFTIRATDANGCFGALNYAIAIAAVPVPTLSEWAMIGLILMLAAVGYLALRGQNKGRAA